MTTRRDFLKVAGTALAAGGLSSLLHAPARAQTPGGFKKAVKFGMVHSDGPLVEKFKLLAELGFDGVEMDSPTGLDRDDVLRARDESGLPIHGVVDSVHWQDSLSHPDPDVRARGVEALQTAVRDAHYWGGTSVLLVPAVVSKEVAYDDAYVCSQAEIRKVLPLAEELGITIALENVWNNFLVSPLETARYIDELESTLVRAYFDVGNVLRYGWPEQWIRVLGPRIAKLDIKEYSLEKMNTQGLWKGFEVELLEGDCDWPAVMAALRDVEFVGWGTAEIPGGGRDRLQDIARRMDRIFAS
jgi:hexulose-6-phosphate isomerase